MDASELERIICNDPALGEVRAGEVMFASGGECVGTMASPDTEQELEEFLGAVDRVLKRRTGQGIRFTRRWRQAGMNVFVVIHATPGNEQPSAPAEPSPLPATAPPPTPPDLIPTTRMAEQSFENAIMFWWPEPAPGLIYILWADGAWDVVADCDHPGQSGFEWAAQQRPSVGHPKGGEQHSAGLVRKDENATWIVAPSDLDVFVLLPSRTWQIVEA